MLRQWRCVLVVVVVVVAQEKVPGEGLTVENVTLYQTAVQQYKVLTQNVNWVRFYTGL